MTEPRPSPSAPENPLNLIVQEVERHPRALMYAPAAAAVLGALLSLVVPPQFAGVAVFAPAPDVSSSLPGNLQALASQFGISAGAGGYSVYYFTQIAQSQAALRLVASDTLAFDGRRESVLDLLEAEGDSAAERLDDGVERLRNVLSLRADDQSELVTLRALGRSPGEARAFAEAALTALDSVTRASIQLGGSAERRFAQGQADTAGAVLRRAENELRDFYVANRNFASSPTLQFEETRLRRQVQLAQDIYVAMVNQAQAAKLQEVRNTPAIQVIQPPQASTQKVWPSLPAFAAFGLIGALAVGLGWLYLWTPVGAPLLRAALLPLRRWLASRR